MDDAEDAGRRGACAAFSAPPPGGGGREAHGGRVDVGEASLDHCFFADAYGRRRIRVSLLGEGQVFLPVLHTALFSPLFRAAAGGEKSGSAAPRLRGAGRRGAPLWFASSCWSYSVMVCVAPRSNGIGADSRRRVPLLSNAPPLGAKAQRAIRKWFCRPVLRRSISRVMRRAAARLRFARNRFGGPRA